MKSSMFIVKHEGLHHGPFLEIEAEIFVSKLEGDAVIVPLFVPVPAEEYRGPLKLQVMQDDAYRAHVDSFKIDTHHTLTGIMQEIWFARRDERVLTVREMLDLWRHLFRVSRAVESLMTYANLAVEKPGTESLEALRKAFWRNRDSDDVDPHYEDRFW
jgi:hypothetical protein